MSPVSSRAAGVEYHQKGQATQAHAAREVISSGGTFQSAQLLMLSGIGDGDHLRSVGINAIADLEGVGQNLHDHVGAQVQITCPEPVSSKRILRAAHNP